MVGEPDATMQSAAQDYQLMPKHRVLSLKPQFRFEWRGQDVHNETEQPNHSASLRDSVTSSTRIGCAVHTGGIAPLYMRAVSNTGESPILCASATASGLT